MTFNPNAQGVFLLGQLVLDYSNVDYSNSRDNVRMKDINGNVIPPPFGNNAFSGDGPHALNPEAQEFYPTDTTTGAKIPLNNHNTNNMTAAEHYEVRVFNTPLITHLQFPREFPYQGYPRTGGYPHRHHHFHHMTPAAPSNIPSDTASRPENRNNNDNNNNNTAGMPHVIPAPNQPIFPMPANYGRQTGWIPAPPFPSLNSHNVCCSSMPTTLHFTGNVQECSGHMMNSHTPSIPVTETPYPPVYVSQEESSYMSREANSPQENGLNKEGPCISNGPQDLLLLSSPVSADPSRGTSPLDFSSGSIEMNQSNADSKDCTVCLNDLMQSTEDISADVPIVDSHELQDDDDEENANFANKNWNLEAPPFFPVQADDGTTVAYAGSRNNEDEDDDNNDHSKLPLNLDDDDEGDPVATPEDSTKSRYNTN